MARSVEEIPEELNQYLEILRATLSIGAEHDLTPEHLELMRLLEVLTDQGLGTPEEQLMAWLTNANPL